MRHLLLLPLVVLALFADQPRTHAAEPLDFIPVDAGVVIRLQVPKAAVEDVANFVDLVQPGFGGLVRAQMTSLGGGIFNPTLAGVDMSRDWLVAVFPQATSPPDVLFLIPTSDSAALKKAVGAEFHFAENGDWTAYSKSASLVEDTDQPPISSLIDRRVQQQLNAGHMSVLVNAVSLQKTFSKEMAQAEDQLNVLIDQMALQVPRNSPGIDLEYVWDMYRELGRAAIQAVRDSKSLVVTLNIADGVLQIDELLTINEDSPTDSFLKSQPVSDMARLTSVPQGLMGYWGVSGDFKPMLPWIEQFMARALKDDAVKEKFAKSLAIVRETEFGTIAGGGDIVNGDVGVLRYYGISEVSPVAKVREAFLLMASMSEYEIGGIRQQQSFEAGAETIEGQSVDLYHFKQEIAPELDPLGMQKAINEKMYGPDGMTQRLIFREDILLQTLGGGSASMKRLLNAEAWSDKQLLNARKRLPEEANILFLVDAPTFVHKMLQVVVESGSLPIPLKPEQLDSLEIARSYAGFALSAEPQHLHARTCLPVETFQGFAQIGMFIQMQMRGR